MRERSLCNRCVACNCAAHNAAAKCAHLRSCTLALVVGIGDMLQLCIIMCTVYYTIVHMSLCPYMLVLCAFI